MMKEAIPHRVSGFALGAIIFQWSYGNNPADCYHQTGDEISEGLTLLAIKKHQGFFRLESSEEQIDKGFLTRPAKHPCCIEWTGDRINLPRPTLIASSQMELELNRISFVESPMTS